MIKKYNGRLFAFFGFLFICIIMCFFASSLQGGEKHYEIRPEIIVPEYKTDLSRLVDAYEHLMNNYMRLTEQNSSGIYTNTKDITKKIDLIDQKLTALSAQIETIQKKLGIEVPQPPTILKIESGNTESVKRTDQQSVDQ